VGQIVERGKAFLLTAVAGSQDAVVLQNERVVAKKGGPLSPRNLSTGWVVGQQGNIDGEYWNGDLFELLVFDRELTEPERLTVSRELAKRHGLALSAETQQVVSPPDPELLAWASLCHVLLNSNEFIYVD
ncbi:MAG TPA: hypothetical protein PLV92_15800, partial [Pirellulaceae bacterium]|nr:hypothetical protein [Pirellulaceae bacterium]